MAQIPYAKQTWTDDSSTASAARFTVLENGIYEVSLAPAVRVYHNTTQSITTATWTALAFNSERFDTCAGAADTMHDTVTNNSRLTCRYAGKYMITGCAEFAANATGVRYIRIRHGGATVIASQQINFTPGGADATILHINTIYDLAVNDYVELMVYQSSGAGLNVNSTGNYSPEFSMCRIA